MRLVRTIGDLATRSRRGGVLSTLIFHQVLPAPDPMRPSEIDAALFTRLMTWLASVFRVLPLDEALEKLKGGALPPRAACITFDDGYADNFQVATPILQKLGMHATFFVSTGFLDGGHMWNDGIIETLRRVDGANPGLSSVGLDRTSVATASDRAASAYRLIDSLKHLPQGERAERVARIEALVEPGVLPTNLMMTRGEVRQLHAAGMGVGAHTVTHPILTRIDDNRARKEMADSRDELVSIVGGPVNLFAYPNGKPVRDYAAPHVKMAREVGFTAAVSTSWGVAIPGGDLFQVPRFTPWDRQRGRFTARLLQNCLRRRSDTV